MHTPSYHQRYPHGPRSAAYPRTGNPARGVPGLSAGPRGRPAKPAKLPKEWVNANEVYLGCEVTQEELDEASTRAWADLTRGKKPVAAGVRPHLILTIGAPGVGKSTVAAHVAPSRNYVVVDYDVAVKYHPRYRGMWIPSAVTEKPVSVGLTLRYDQCNTALVGAFAGVVAEILASDEKYNVILQSHRHPDNIVEFAEAGYRVTLVFVGAPLATALARSRARSVETGRFFAPTLALQAEGTKKMWDYYRRMAPWYGLWSDEFLVVSNGGDDPRAAGRGATRVAFTSKTLAKAEAAVRAACV